METILQLAFIWLHFANTIHSSVILSGGPYCSTDGGSVQHSVPGTVISITCAVDNPSPGANLLEWTIPSYGVSVANVNGAKGADADQPDFVSVVNSFNNTEDTTNATLTFTAVSKLDEAVVTCADVTESTSRCTLYVLTPPSSLQELECSTITYSSVSLMWIPPADNGGEPISHYNISRTPGGTMMTTETRITEKYLSANTSYKFVVNANNSQGFGKSINISCTTTVGQVFSHIQSVQVCLGLFNKTYNNISINMTENCPPSSPDLATPPFDNFTIDITGLNPIFTKFCEYNWLIKTETQRYEYNITVTINNQVGPSEPTTERFDSRWIKNIQLTRRALSYHIVDCTTVEDANVTLTITESGGSTMLFTDEQPYDQDYTTFNISSFMIRRSPAKSYSYTLMIIAPGTTIISITSELKIVADLMKTPSLSVISQASSSKTVSVDLISVTASPRARSASRITGVIIGVVVGAALLCVLPIIIVILVYYITFQRNKLEYEVSQPNLKSSNLNQTSAVREYELPNYSEIPNNNGVMNTTHKRTYNHVLL